MKQRLSVRESGSAPQWSHAYELAAEQRRIDDLLVAPSEQPAPNVNEVPAGVKNLNSNLEKNARALSLEAVDRPKEQFNTTDGGDCPVCTETRPEWELMTFSCGHVMCIECCSRDEYKTNLGERGRKKCPH